MLAYLLFQSVLQTSGRYHTPNMVTIPNNSLRRRLLLLLVPVLQPFSYTLLNIPPDGHSNGEVKGSKYPST